jgi:hypothetical protein
MAAWLDEVAIDAAIGRGGEKKCRSRRLMTAANDKDQ